jgi:hypothetical protein
MDYLFMRALQKLDAGQNGQKLLHGFATFYAVLTP